MRIFSFSLLVSSRYFCFSRITQILKFRYIFLLNLVQAIVWSSLVIIPQAVDFDYAKLSSSSFAVNNLIDGKGVFGDTWMFYGVCLLIVLEIKP